MKRKDILSNPIKSLTFIRYFIFFIIMMLVHVTRGQLNLNFDDGNLNVVKWEGNLSNFKINAQGQLQLSASAAGESSIFTKYKVPSDSIQFDLYFKLQFAPSADNFGKIYLFVDDVNESKANGYYLKLGENGSNDAIQVYSLENGISQLLGSGKLGGISADPADARLRFKIYRNGLWMMATDYSGNTVYEDELKFTEQGFALKDSLYFGLYCKYTATRVDKFFYDDIAINTIKKDTIPPLAVSIEVVDENQIKLVFNESLDINSASNVANYTIDNGLGSPDYVTYSLSKPLEVRLIYDIKPIRSGIEYTLTIDQVKDKNQNYKNQNLQFAYASKPRIGDLVITEVLTDPYSGGDDFVEIYNNSTNFLRIDSLVILNAQKNESKVIRTSEILYPGKYLAISKNVGFLKTTYATPDSARFLDAVLPSLNVDGANVSIISYQNGIGLTIDSFDYSETMQFDLLDNTKGVSLERIDNKGNTNDLNNWHSASSLTKYATPGYKNSNAIQLEPLENDAIKPDKKVFSPNGDSVDDFVLLQYKLNKSGFLGTVKVFDADGFHVYDLANNVLLGQEGSLKWDGINSENNIVKMGMYIVYSRFFHTDGDIIETRHVVIATQNF